MKKKLLITFAITLLIAGGIGFYLFNMPHRNIQESSTDYFVKADQLVNEFLNDYEKANLKYLDEEGESKIFEVKGQVSEITTDFNGQNVILLKNSSSKAGVSSTFLSDSDQELKKIKIGNIITIKGVIRSGATYDEDLEMYEHVIIEKCKLISINK
jgi:hypothetical protein